MIIYAPYLALVFWGTMIFFGVGDIIKKGKAPAIFFKPANKLGNIVFIIAFIMIAVAFFLAYQDSEIIRRRESPVGLFTCIAFIPLVIGDILLATKIFKPKQP